MKITLETPASAPFSLSASPAAENLVMAQADNPSTVVAAVDAITTGPLNAQHLASLLAPMSASLDGALPNVTNPANEADAADGALLWIDPNRIRLMQMPNRDSAAFDSEEFEELRIGILSNGGNTVPICVVQLDKPDGNFDYELVYGQRRMHACKLVKLFVLAIVKQAAQLAPEQRPFDSVRENLARQDLSPYELGRQLKYLIDADPSLSVRELGWQMGRHHSGLSAAIKLAGLPSEVVAAFARSADLQFRFEGPLSQAWAKNSEAVRQASRDIQALTERPPAKAVFERLVAAASGTLEDTKKDAVEPLNSLDNSSDSAAPGLLYSQGKAVGRVVFDKRQHAKITLDARLSDQQQAALHKHMAAFVKRHFSIAEAAPGSADAAQIAAPTHPTDAAKASALLGAAPQAQP